MTEDEIAEVGIDEGGKLYVRPAATSFDYIYRATMEVNWDTSNRRLYGPKPRDWSYRQWFDQILAAAADEYGVRLKLGPATIWSNVSDDLKTEIQAVA